MGLAAAFGFAGFGLEEFVLEPDAGEALAAFAGEDGENGPNGDEAGEEQPQGHAAGGIGWVGGWV